MDELEAWLWAVFTKVSQESPETNLAEFISDIVAKFIEEGIIDMNSLISWATCPEEMWILYPDNPKLKDLLEEKCNMEFSCPFRIQLVLVLKRKVQQRGGKDSFPAL